MVTAHKITLEKTGQRIKVRCRGLTVADSRDVIRLNEGTLPIVYYFPRGDVVMELLQPSDRQTHCPFKGDAVYWSVCAGEDMVPDAVWSYEEPFEEVAAIARRLAFYPQHVEFDEEGQD